MTNDKGYLSGIRISTSAGGADLEEWKPLPSDVVHDVLRAEVARVNTGVCTYSLTLNNAYHSTPEDRAATDLGGEAYRRELVAAGTPFWPRFKYNDFFHFEFGQRLRIEMRRWPQPEDEKGANLNPWIPMIAGPITDMRFGFAAGQGAQLTLTGEDDLGRLKDKHDKSVAMSKLPEYEIVTRILKAESAAPRFTRKLAIAQQRKDLPGFVVDKAQGIDESLQAGQSYLDAIQKIADRLDFEVFVEFDPTHGPTSEPKLHFETYRGRVRPDSAARDVFLLERGKNLVEYNPTIKVSDQYTTVKVTGRHRDPKRPEEVTAVAMGSVLADELHHPQGAKGTLVPAPLVRERFYKGRPNHHVASGSSNLDGARAEVYAEAIIRKKARELFSVEGATVGLPELRPGKHVEIRGMRTPFDGFFYVTKTTHTFGADGFRTKFVGNRPGMELPDVGTGLPDADKRYASEKP